MMNRLESKNETTESNIESSEVEIKEQETLEIETEVTGVKTYYTKMMMEKMKSSYQETKYFKKYIGLSHIKWMRSPCMMYKRVFSDNESISFYIFRTSNPIWELVNISEPFVVVGSNGIVFISHFEMLTMSQAEQGFMLMRHRRKKMLFYDMDMNDIRARMPEPECFVLGTTTNTYHLFICDNYKFSILKNGNPKMFLKVFRALDIPSKEEVIELGKRSTLVSYNGTILIPNNLNPGRVTIYSTERTVKSDWELEFDGFTHLVTYTQKEGRLIKGLPFSETTFSINQKADRPAMRVARDRMLMEEMKTIITTHNIPEALTMQMVSEYYHARHDLLLEAVCNVLSIPHSNDFKVSDMISEFKGTEFENLTPDIFVRLNKEMTPNFNKIRLNLFEMTGMSTLTYLMADVAVTSRVGDMIQSKAAKYAEMCNYYNNLTRRDNTVQRMVFVPIILDLRTMEITSEALFYKIDMEEIKRICTTIQNFHASLGINQEFHIMSDRIFSEQEVSISWRDLDQFFFPVNSRSFNESFRAVNDNIPEDKDIDEELRIFEMSEEEEDTYIDNLISMVMGIYEQCSNGNKENPKFSEVKKMLMLGRKPEEVLESVEKLETDLCSRNPEKINSMDLLQFPFCKIPLYISEETCESSVITINDYIDDLIVVKYDDVDMIDDMTAIANARKEYEFKEEEVNRVGYNYDSIIAEYSEGFCESLMDTNLSPYGNFNLMIQELEESLKHPEQKLVMQKIRDLNCVKLAYEVQVISLEIMYNLGRRRMDRNRKNCTVFRVMESGDLLQLAPGSAISREKQAVFRIISRREPGTSVARYFHQMEHVLMKENGLMCTKWLSISFADLEHYCRMFSRMIGVMTQILTDYCNGMDISLRELDIRDSMFGLPAAMLLEHKRATSTTLQMSRYLYHSALSIVSDKLGIFKRIGEDPIRTPLQLFVIHKQKAWFKKMMMEYVEYMKEFVRTSMSKERGARYNRYYLPSMYTNKNKKIEIGFMMNEMYYCNLFNKEHGFMGHRVKAIMEKMSEDEFKFRRNAKCSFFTGIVENLEEFLSLGDEYMLFDRKYVYCAGRLIFNKYLSKMNLNRFYNIMNENFLRLTTLKSSVIQSRVEMETGLPSGPEEVRAKTYDTQRNIFEEKRVNNILEYHNETPFFRIYFGTFPKAQIGGPREIFIQDQMSRALVRTVESFMENLAKMIPYEMITKGDRKFLIQANIRDKMETRPNYSTKSRKMFLSYNKDHSHWGPAMNVLHYAYLFKGMGIPPNMQESLISLVRAFADKRVSMPPALINKWKDERREEADEVMETLRKTAVENNFVVQMASGMGQGMLHYTSSVYHCAIWEFQRKITEKMMKRLDIWVEEETLLSSDDVTDHIMVYYNNHEDLKVTLGIYLFSKQLCFKLGNLHENYKKSGLSPIVSEFNSMFMIGKRALAVTLKDVYTAFDIVDMTIPEDAVRATISNERRLISSGANFSMISLARALNSQFLKYCYRFGADDLEYLKALFRTENMNLIPFNLGFLPNDMIIESLMLGPEIYLYREDNNERVTKFYSSVFFAEMNEDSHLRIPYSISETELGKAYIQFPTRSDSMMRDMLGKWMVDPNSVLYDVEDLWESQIEMMGDRDELRLLMNYYLCNSGTLYEMRDTFRLHSLIRALANTTGKGEIHGITEEELIRYRSPMMDFNTKVTKKCFSILNFAEIFLNREVTHDLSLLPQSLVLKEVAGNSFNLFRMLETAPLNMEKGKHYKYRELNLGSLFSSGSCSYKEIVRNLEGDDRSTGRRVTNTMKRFSEFSKVDIMSCSSMEDLSARLFPNHEKKVLSTLRFLERFCKVQSHRTFQGVSPFPDQGSAVANIMSLYRYIYYSNGILDTEGKSEPEFSQTSKYLCNVINASSNMEQAQRVFQRSGMCESIWDNDFFEDTNEKLITLEVFRMMMSMSSHEDIFSRFKSRTIYKFIKEKNSDRNFHIHLRSEEAMILITTPSRQYAEYYCKNYDEHSLVEMLHKVKPDVNLLLSRNTIDNERIPTTWEGVGVVIKDWEMLRFSDPTFHIKCKNQQTTLNLWVLMKGIIPTRINFKISKAFTPNYVMPERKIERAWDNCEKLFNAMCLEYFEGENEVFEALVSCKGMKELRLIKDMFDYPRISRQEWASRRREIEAMKTGEDTFSIRMRDYIDTFEEHDEEEYRMQAVSLNNILQGGVMNILATNMMQMTFGGVVSEEAAVEEKMEDAAWMNNLISETDLFNFLEGVANEDEFEMNEVELDETGESIESRIMLAALNRISNMMSINVSDIIKAAGSFIDNMKRVHRGQKTLTKRALVGFFIDSCFEIDRMFSLVVNQREENLSSIKALISFIVLFYAKITFKSEIDEEQGDVNFPSFLRTEVTAPIRVMTFRERFTLPIEALEEL